MYNKRLSAAAATLIVSNVVILLAFESFQEFSWSRIWMYAIVSLSSIFMLWKVALVIKSDLQSRCEDLERDVHGLSHDIRGPLQAALFASELLRKELEPSESSSFMFSPSGMEISFQQPPNSSAPVFNFLEGDQERVSRSSLVLGESTFVEPLNLVDLIRSNVIFASLMANNTLEKMCDTSKSEDSAFTIYEIVDTVISTIEGLHLGGENIETSFFSKTADARVVCDLQQVQRLIMNLTINALKFSKTRAAEQGAHSKVATEGPTPLATHVSIDVMQSLEAVRNMLAEDEKHMRHASRKVVGVRKGIRTPIYGSQANSTGSAVSPYVNEAYLVITVSDQGDGMTKQTLNACVEHFPSRVTKRPGGGFGLGLHLTKKFCFDHMGGMAISSTPNVGTTVSAFFRVEIMEGGGDRGEDGRDPCASRELRRTIVGLTARSKRPVCSGSVHESGSLLKSGSLYGFSRVLPTEENLHSSSKRTDRQGIHLPPLRKAPGPGPARDEIPPPQGEAPSCPAVQGPRTRSGGAGAKRRRTVVNLDLIICDDDVPSLRLSERILADRISGVVYTFSRAESALECISGLFAAEQVAEEDGSLPPQQQRPVVLLTDLNFVGSRMQGVELIQKARSTCPRLKIVVVSGDQSTELLQTMNEAGVDRVMYKPVTSSQVDSVFRSLFLAHPLRVKITKVVG